MTTVPYSRVWATFSQLCSSTRPDGGPSISTVPGSSGGLPARVLHLPEDSGEEK
jgi:hypothetical protein